MDAVLLALASAFLFGAMTVALRFALRRSPDAELGALLTIVPALAVTLPFVAAQSIDLSGIWPFLLAGLLGPGLSQLLFTLAVRDAGPSRTSVAVGTAPLFSVVIALIFLDEPLQAGLVARCAPDRLRRRAARRRAGAPRAREADRSRARGPGGGRLRRARQPRALALDRHRRLARRSPRRRRSAPAALCVAVYVLATRRGHVSFRRLPVFVPAGPALRALLHLPLRGLLPRSRHRGLAARRDRVALGGRALGAACCGGTSSWGRACSAAPCSSSRAAR